MNPQFRYAKTTEGVNIACATAHTVRGLSSGNGLLFPDRGEFVAKAIEEPVRVYGVNWHG